MQKEQYDILLSDLNEGKCVLILGPEFFLLQNEEENLIENLRDIIFNHRDKLKNKPYLSEDGFFYVDKTSQDRRTILHDVYTYYKELSVPSFYKTLAKLPFKLIINLSPDDLFSRALNACYRPHEFLYYKKGDGLYNRSLEKNSGRPILEKIVEPSKLPEPSFERPWIFNFLGILDDRESMIFTFDALFEFLYSIFPVNNIPDKLRLAIRNSNSFLFLGFDYNKWYLKIIFFLLNKICEDNGVEKKAIFNYNDKHIGAVNFYQSQFNLNFYRESTISFINNLYNDSDPKWDKAEPDLPYRSKSNVCRILYLSSLPSGKLHFRFDKEFKLLEEALQKSKNRGDFDLSLKASITRKDMLKHIHEYTPEILVISMHGSIDKGLCFQNNNDECDYMNVEEFEDHIRLLIENPNNSLKCILFSCCHSSKFAHQISKIVSYSIGIEGAAVDELMCEFSEGFFDSYFSNRNVSLAYDMSKINIGQNKKLKSYTPLLRFYSMQKITAI